jgi:hypothetical protein
MKLIGPNADNNKSHNTIEAAEATLHQTLTLPSFIR